ncbi:MAG: hypothetical protein KA154_01755 [Gemmatimonadaceae bacterium]|jgi:formylmethanofuran dehydrogenase subunit B|nr:hypothetical protein [Gemmatimonadaceae bacterium]MCC6243843.1 hypothetical protein [Gemmatimonadaceae bacterium]
MSHPRKVPGSASADAAHVAQRGRVCGTQRRETRDDLRIDVREQRSRIIVDKRFALRLEYDLLGVVQHLASFVRGHAVEYAGNVPQVKRE